MNKTTGFLARLALAGLGIALALIMAELGIRLVESQTGPLFYSGLGNAEYDPRFVQPHPVLEVEHRKNASYRIISREHPSGYFELRTNNLGLRRDEDTAIPKPSNVYRILVLGDSQTDGLVNNAEAWPNVLERLLNQQAPRADGRRYEVLDAGVITYQPYQEFLWWRIYGRQLQPDMVIWAYYIGNDMLDAGGDRVKQTASGSWQLDESPHPRPPESPLRTFLHNCRVCVLASYSLRGGPLEGVAAKFGLIGSATESRLVQAHRTCMGCTWQSVYQASVYEQDPQKYQHDLAATEWILKEMKSEVEKTGAEFAMVMIPSKLQVEGDTNGRAVQVANVLGMVLPNPPFEDRVEQDVVAVAGRNNITAIEVLEGLRTAFARMGQPLYYAEDWHLNAEGNAVFAQSILTAWSTSLVRAGSK